MSENMNSPTTNDHLPSFMSVFGEGPSMIDHTEEHRERFAAGTNTASSSNRPPPLGSIDSRFEGQHQHRGSTSTTNSESTDSSPTTTISTADSSSISDPSPNSSPESPISIIPLSSFASRTPDEMTMSPPLSPLFGYHQPLSPGKKPRNTKNLSLNMAAPTRQPPPPPQRVKTASAADTLYQSAPVSPSFIVPSKPPKKRPSNLGLTIKTPAGGSLPDDLSKGLKIVPPTPSMNRPNLLRHHQSSPSLSLFSPTWTETQIGMQLPPSNPQHPTTSFLQPNSTHSSRHSSVKSLSSMSDLASSTGSNRLDELEEEEDLDPPLSHEAKSPAYPSGPLCIYDPHVYLYLEPTDEEASNFDVILNVAREVKNPFAMKGDLCQDTSSVTSEVSSLAIQSPIVPEPDTATSLSSFETAYESLPSADAATPTTPKAISARPQPEYIHVLWDHNTNIVDDLMHLVELIDERVRQGKKVLIHCQCGVSRSASLVVAYGLYKNPSLTVQEAYDAVKRRSKWIGPNMSLIYQLSEFRTLLVKKHGIAQPNYRSWRGSGSKLGLLNSGRANTVPTGGSPRPSLSVNSSDIAREPPQTAPLPDDRDRTPITSSPLNDESPPLLGLGERMTGIVSPGPSSAPSGLAWIPRGGDSVETHGGSWGCGNKHVGFVPPPLPPDSAYLEARMDDAAEPSQVHPQVVTTQTPPSPDLMSPRATEFTANPFHHLETTSSFGFDAFKSSQPYVDPRSPAQRGEAPIVRSIFDVL
ncbi:MAG: hypothetical protein M1833_000535 [Piccolia ochrophora]|nr:MAG: hypothetical protein M1833_000535 [Piccolia ochrophora]